MERTKMRIPLIQVIQLKKLKFSCAHGNYWINQQKAFLIKNYTLEHET